MSIHLVGGGRDESLCAELLAPFVSEAMDSARGVDLAIAMLLVLEEDDDTSVERFRSVLVSAGAPVASVRAEVITEGEVFRQTAVAGAHGVFVGGGLTPAYHGALIGIAPTIRSAVAAGVPYAGFSAGAAVAASRAIVGGYLRDGVVVAPEDTAEEIDEVEVRDGLALVPDSIDVHAAQWGTLSRLVSAVDAGLTPAGVAIDEHTSVIVRDGETRVHGIGHAWKVTRSASGAAVTMTSRTDG